MTELTKHEPTTIYIKPSTGFTALNLRDLWLYRELVFFMVWRDIKVRYKQTFLGAAWAILTEATLSFIGLSDPTAISWGLMLNQAFASGAIRFAWWWVVPPGVSLALLLGALFLLARSIEGAVDRRLAD